MIFIHFSTLRIFHVKMATFERGGSASIYINTFTLYYRKFIYNGLTHKICQYMKKKKRKYC